MSSVRERFGGARLAGEGNFKPPFSLKEGIQSFRLLPAMKSLRDSNTWAVYHKQHFGYSGRDSKDPTKTRMRPFACIEEVNRQTEMIEVSCPECRKIEAQKRLADDREQGIRSELKLKGILNEAEIEAHLAQEPRLAPLKGWLRAHNLDKKWYMNVMKEGGEFGVLRIGHKAKQALDKRIKDLISEGTNPFDFDQGAFFVFRREGKGLKTEDTVDVLMEQTLVGGQRMKSVKLAPLTDAQLEQADKDCSDLTTLVRRISPEQIKMLVDGSGEPEEVDVILAMSQKAGQERNSASRTHTPSSTSTGATPPAASSTPAPISNPIAPTQTPSPAVGIAAMQAAYQQQLAQMQAAFQAQLAAAMAAGTPTPVPGIPTATAVTAAVPASSQSSSAKPPASRELTAGDLNMTPEQFAALFPPPPKA